MSEVKHTEDQVSEFFSFLDDLRAGAKINMFGAGPYLREEFGITRDESDVIMKAWFKSDLRIPARDRAADFIAKATGA